jgi:hypothetical protein
LALVFYFELRLLPGEAGAVDAVIAIAAATAAVPLRRTRPMFAMASKDGFNSRLESVSR